MINVDAPDPKKLYNPVSVGVVNSLAFSSFLRDVDAPAASTIHVGPPDFVRKPGSMLTSLPLAVWKSYLR